MFCSKCGNEISLNSKFCRNCGLKLLAKENKEKQQEKENDSDKVEKKNSLQTNAELIGIAGWLSLLGLGLMVAPLRILYYMIIYWSNYPLFMIIGNFLSAVFVGYVFFVMTKHKKAFVNYCAIWFILQMLLSVGYYFALKNFYIMTPEMTSASQQDIAGSVIFGLVWIIYLRDSRRVKLTFTK